MIRVVGSLLVVCLMMNAVTQAKALPIITEDTSPTTDPDSNTEDYLDMSVNGKDQNNTEWSNLNRDSLDRTKREAGTSKYPAPFIKDADYFSAEKILTAKLLDTYKLMGTHGRPIKNYSSPLDVTVALHLVQILDLDEQNQVLTTSIRTHFVWNDDFLMWDVDEYDGVHTIGLSPNEIWVPDIILSNSVAEEENIDKFAIVRVSANGSVHWGQRKVYRTSCQINMENYPFDSQYCDMVVKSSSYSLEELDLVSMYGEDTNLLEVAKHHILREYIEAREWEVVEVKMYEDFQDTTSADTMRYAITLRRKVVFFTYILMLPCVFLTILTMVIFWLPPERPDKTTLAMSIFGSFTVLLLVLVGSIPSTASSVPILGVYYFFNMVITALSIALATIVVNISRTNKATPQVPRWLKLIAIDTLGGIFGVHGGKLNFGESNIAERLKQKEAFKKRDKLRRKHAKKRKKMGLPPLPEEKTDQRSTATGIPILSKTGQPATSARSTVSHSPGVSLAQLEKEAKEEGQTAKIQASAVKTRSTGGFALSGMSKFRKAVANVVDLQKKDDKKPDPGLGNLNLANMSEDSRCLNRIEWLVRESRDYVKQISENSQGRERKMDSRDEKAMEWHAVAVALDRCFFFIYLAVSFVVALVSSAILFPRAF